MPEKKPASNDQLKREGLIREAKERSGNVVRQMSRKGSFEGGGSGPTG